MIEMTLINVLPWHLFGFFFTLLSGYFLGLGFFPLKKTFSKIERMVFSLLLSLAIIPFVLLIENIALIPLNSVNVFLTGIILSLLGVFVYFIRIQKIKIFFGKKLGLIEKQDAFPLNPLKK